MDSSIRRRGLVGTERQRAADPAKHRDEGLAVELLNGARVVIRDVGGVNEVANRQAGRRTHERVDRFVVEVTSACIARAGDRPRMAAIVLGQFVYRRVEEAAGVAQIYTGRAFDRK